MVVSMWLTFLAHPLVYASMPISGACALESLKSLICHATEGVEHTHTHTHTRLTAPCPGLPGWAGTRKVKPIWILLKQETVSGNGISWAICKSALRSRQITMPAPHHSVFLQAGCPFCRPTDSVKARKECNRPSIRQWLRGGHIMISTEWRSARASRAVRRNVQWMPMRRCGRDTALS